jgi:secreted trypsin-like serine protease
MINTSPTHSALLFLTVALGLSLTACQPDSGDPGSDPTNPPDKGIVHGQLSKSNGLSNSVVALVADVPEGQTLCTGSILSENSVLTAAHCVDNNPERMVVVFGKNIHSAKQESMRPVTNFVQNPYWSHPNSTNQGDLAIVHFSGGLPAGYVPVHLVNASEKVSEGDSVYFIGYGVTNGKSQKGSGILRATTTQIIGEQSPTETITDGQKTSVCFGDSGGPAFVKVKNKFLQWGVASSVLNQTCNEASIHTNIMTYLNWIRNEVASTGVEPSGGTPHRRHKKNSISADDETP